MKSQPRYFEVEPEVGTLSVNEKKLTYREVRWKVDDKTMFHGTTVGFLCGDRQRKCFCVDVRAICNVWTKINYATFLTDEQNTLSLCPVEDPRNLFVVRIRCVSVM